MKELPEKRADIIANIVEQTWLTRYPRPSVITYDRGTEFMAEFRTLVMEEYDIDVRAITTGNPQANAILERVHQTMGNMLRTFRTHSAELDPTDPWSGILAAIQFAVRATVHTTLQATPMQLVFGRDAFFNVPYIADWEAIRQRKQKLINKNNARENSRRIPHVYHVGDQVVLKKALGK